MPHMPMHGTPIFSGHVLSAHGGDFRHAEAVCAPCYADVGALDRENDEEDGPWSDLDSIFNDLADGQGRSEEQDLSQPVSADSDAIRACAGLLLSQDRIVNGWEMHSVVAADAVAVAGIHSGGTYPIATASTAWVDSDTQPAHTPKSRVFSSPFATPISDSRPTPVPPSCVGRSAVAADEALRSQSPEVFSFLKRKAPCCESHSRSARGGV
jgi:hypothetical protein